MTLSLALLLLVASSDCAAPDLADPRVEAVSLLGSPLERPQPAADFRAEQERMLELAQQAFALDPNDLDLAVWIGRRLGYLGRYREAVVHYSQSIERWPDEPQLLRHRGHRWITLRRFDCAVADLTRAAQLVAGRDDPIEPDGMPNAAGIPRSSLHDNISYHLALAHYLGGDFERAAQEFARCYALNRNDDLRVAAAYWQVLSLWRAGQPQAADEILAQIRPQMAVLENHDYHRLLLSFAGRGEALEVPDADSVANATLLYGLSCAAERRGDGERARELRERIVSGSSWAAFGAIAAEVDLARNRARR